MSKYIGIRIGAAFLELARDTSITLEVSTGIMNFGEVEGTFSFPFDVPYSAHNAGILGHKDRIESSEDTSVPYDAELWLYGRFFMRGMLKILPWKGKSYEAYFTSGAGNLKELLGTESLKKVFENDTVQVSTTSATLQGHRILVDNPTSRPDVGFALGDAQGTLYSFSGNSRRSGFYAIAGAINNHPVVRATATVISVDGKMGWDVVFETGVVYSYNNGRLNHTRTDIPPMDKLSFPETVDYTNVLCYPSIRMGDMYEGKVPSFIGIANHYVDGSLVAENAPVETDSRVNRRNPEMAVGWQYALMPQVYNKWVLTALFARAGVRVSGSFLEDPDLSSLFVFNPHTLDKLEYLAGASKPIKNVHDLLVQVKRHIPDVTLGHYLNALRTAFGLLMVWNFQRTECRLVHVEDVLKSQDVDDWTDKAESLKEVGAAELWRGIRFEFELDSDDQALKERIGNPFPYSNAVEEMDTTNGIAALSPAVNDIAYVRSYNMYLRYGNQKVEDPEWKELGWHLGGYEYQGNGKTIKCRLSPLQCRTTEEDIKLRVGVLTVDSQRLMPYLEYKATSLPLDQQAEYGLRIAFYRGMQADGAGKLYGMANSNSFKSDESRDENWTHDLQWSRSDRSLFDKYWKTYARWIRTTRPVLARVRLSMAELIQTDLSKKKRIGNMNYVVEKIILRIGPTGAEPVEAYLQSVRDIVESNG